MKNYFINCETLDDAKKLYKNLAKKFHPDFNHELKNAKELFQEMNNEYDSFCKNFGGKEKYEGEKENFDSEKFRDMINSLMQIEGIEFEIIGSFFWISGTKKEEVEKREKIKAINNELYKNAMWHRKKQVWYFAPIGYKRRSGKTFTMDDLRNKYGSEKFQSKGRAKIA